MTTQAVTSPELTLVVGHALALATGAVEVRDLFRAAAAVHASDLAAITEPAGFDAARIKRVLEEWNVPGSRTEMPASQFSPAATSLVRDVHGRDGAAEAIITTLMSQVPTTASDTTAALFHLLRLV